ncbi:MAG: hypothetical protein GY754_18310 [bacterium]|nr:hypothetical protein [bacterium]
MKPPMPPPGESSLKTEETKLTASNKIIEEKNIFDAIKAHFFLILRNIIITMQKQCIITPNRIVVVVKAIEGGFGSVSTLKARNKNIAENSAKAIVVAIIDPGFFIIYPLF